MMLRDALKIVEILLDADNGCPVCAKQLIDKFGFAYPEFALIAYEKYCKEFEV